MGPPGRVFAFTLVGFIDWSDVLACLVITWFVRAEQISGWNLGEK